MAQRIRVPVSDLLETGIKVTPTKNGRAVIEDSCGYRAIHKVYKEGTPDAFIIYLDYWEVKH